MLLVLVVGQVTLSREAFAGRLWETGGSRYLRVRTLDKYERVHQRCSVLHTIAGLYNGATSGAFGRLHGVFPFTLVRVSQLEAHGLLLARTRARTVVCGGQGLSGHHGAARIMSSKSRTRVVLFHRRHFRVWIFQRTIPANVVSTAGRARCRCRGGGLFTLMMSP